MQEELTLWPFPRMVCGSAGGLFEPSVAIPLPAALALGAHLCQGMVVRTV